MSWVVSVFGLVQQQHRAQALAHHSPLSLPPLPRNTSTQIPNTGVTAGPQFVQTALNGALHSHHHRASTQPPRPPNPTRPIHPSACLCSHWTMRGCSTRLSRDHARVCDT